MVYFPGSRIVAGWDKRIFRYSCALLCHPDARSASHPPLDSKTAMTVGCHPLVHMDWSLLVDSNSFWSRNFGSQPIGHLRKRSNVFNCLCFIKISNFLPNSFPDFLAFHPARCQTGAKREPNGWPQKKLVFHLLVKKKNLSNQDSKIVNDISLKWKWSTTIGLH